MVEPAIAAHTTDLNVRLNVHRIRPIVAASVYSEFVLKSLLLLFSILGLHMISKTQPMEESVDLLH